jgi:hypothetical protein
MKNIALALTGWIVLLVGGCGDGNEAGTNHYACDYMQAGAHYCYEWTWTGPEQTGATFKTQCTQYGGSSVGACDRTGAIGGCEIKSTSGGFTSSATLWHYDGDASTLMSSCTQACAGQPSATCTFKNK